MSKPRRSRAFEAPAIPSDQASEDGVVCYLKKPFSDQELIACVQVAVAAPTSDDSKKLPARDGEGAALA